MENGQKILIIDDEEVVLDSCTEILQGSDYEITTATDGGRGLKLVQEFRPDLVFVDLKMPGISGFEVLEKIREHDSTVVTIVITGYATVSSAVEAMKKGAYDFLPKPFTPDEFRLITRRGLEKRTLVLETMALRRERELLRENFAAIVSHELKGPLSAVQQNMFVLEQELAGTASEDQKRRLDRMKTRIKDLLQLVDRWLRGMSVDIEAMKENYQPLAVSSAIEKAVESVLPQAVRKDIEIVTSVEESAGQVMGDEGALTEALVNVLGNAVKYSPTESKVSIAWERKDNQVVISVSDTGVGISEEDLPFIFNGLYRAKSAEGAESGLGVGLAISRRIIEAHDGSISVQSKLGEGSTFVITLPAIEG
ncbi:hypothetical protein AMJ82_12420 [candidate division TA06 bacterium SM23_40]|uniref:histidine kinase n=1 Tax=candidate division TA06 bacterium SM23_40 TaxID=1703774 RepID=A0A0S8G135_UNCT6|nr:MAG: hypothetical protein AMJ82_12420 [candidate division TA06 bacterium SM23_40]